MKCNRLAVYGWKYKRSLNKPSKILFSVEKVDAGFAGFTVDKLEKCDGEIESLVELEYIPYYGGSDANIEVRFKCKKCGYEFAGDSGLPYDVDSLNKFLTEAIAKL
jgi:hypothetical protein